jgi:hypothetical protein
VCHNGIGVSATIDEAALAIAPARLVGFVIACLSLAPALSAQSFEVSPFYGYRFGGSFVDLYTAQPFDLDGAPATGVAFDVRIYDDDDFQIEGLFTHQAADVLLRAVPGLPATRWRVAADHWMAGALQEFNTGRFRPFTTGMAGLTRYAANGDNEFRFTLSAGGGVKMFPAGRVGVRLDGRLFSTFVDGGGNAVACTPGVCLVGLHVDVVWQAEFTAGVVVRLP